MARMLEFAARGDSASAAEEARRLRGIPLLAVWQGELQDIEAGRAP